jgi:hypothetical protein
LATRYYVHPDYCRNERQQDLLMYDEHTAQPNPSSIMPERGLMIEEYLAECIICGKWVSGDENYCFHLTEDEIYYIVPSYLM